MQSLQIELLDRLRRHEAHPGTLHRFGDRLGISEVVLLAPEKGSHILCRHQPGVVAERGKLTAQMMCANASLHADQARRQVGKPLVTASRRSSRWRQSALRSEIMRTMRGGKL